MAKIKKSRQAENEEELQRKEQDNGIRQGPRERQHPHEKQTPVGEDEREYLTEELEEQGYTDEGLQNPNADVKNPLWENRRTGKLSE